MSLYKKRFRRETTRLKDWDYDSCGFYYITILTKYRKKLFGDIVDGKMVLNEYGKILYKCWYDLPNHYNNLKLDKFVIMPDHFHGIMIIVNLKMNTSTNKTIKKHGLFEFVRALKTFSSRRINEYRNTPGTSIWQSRFYDHIIRNKQDLQRIQLYIKNNPGNWGNK